MFLYLFVVCLACLVMTKKRKRRSDIRNEKDEKVPKEVEKRADVILEDPDLVFLAIMMRTAPLVTAIQSGWTK